MKKMNHLKKLTREARKGIMGQGSSCAPTGCYNSSISNSNDDCFIPSCPSARGHIQTVNGKRQCCF